MTVLKVGDYAALGIEHVGIVEEITLNLDTGLATVTVVTPDDVQRRWISNREILKADKRLYDLAERRWLIKTAGRALGVEP